MKFTVLAILLVLLGSGLGLWFEAYHPDMKRPFCFMDQMTDETDFVIKWYAEKKEDAAADSNEVDQEKKKKHGGEIGPDYLYFTIYTYEMLSDTADETAKVSKKEKKKSFYSTEEAEDKSKGIIHVGIENSRLSNN